MCKFIAQSTGRFGDKKLGYLNPKEASVGIEALSKFRNICAHDERIYCASIGGRKSINYAKMTRYLERYLNEQEYKDFQMRLNLELSKINNLLFHSEIMKSLGFNV